MLVVKLAPKVTATWRNEFPPAASPPVELELKDGRTMLWFQEPPAGLYLFRLRAQLPTAGLDPISDVEHRVQVGQRPRPPPVDPTVPVVVPIDPSKVTAATYVYEKDDGMPSSSVMAGLQRLNRERKIIATALEDDSTDGDGDVAEKDKVPLAAARQAWTATDPDYPVFVVMAGSTVLRVAKATKEKPLTETDLLEAVK